MFHLHVLKHIIVIHIYITSTFQLYEVSTTKPVLVYVSVRWPTTDEHRLVLIPPTDQYVDVTIVPSVGTNSMVVERYAEDLANGYLSKFV